MVREGRCAYVVRFMKLPNNGVVGIRIKDSSGKELRIIDVDNYLSEGER